MPERLTVAVDFDGVIHSYHSGWKGPLTIPDPPVLGAIEWLEKVTEQYNVAIYTARCADSSEGWQAISIWLRKHGLSERALGHITFPVAKPHAVLYIDDRGFQFKGTFPTLDFIKGFQPWYKTTPR